MVMPLPQQSGPHPGPHQVRTRVVPDHAAGDVPAPEGAAAVMDVIILRQNINAVVRPDAIIYEVPDFQFPDTNIHPAVRVSGRVQTHRSDFHVLARHAAAQIHEELLVLLIVEVALVARSVIRH